MSIRSTSVRNLARASAIVAISALCIAPLLAAEPTKKESAPAKKPVATSKTTAKTAATKAKPAAKAASGTCAPVPVDCKLPANFVEPVCKPAAPQAAGQKFNTFEDIYSPPSKS